MEPIAEPIPPWVGVDQDEFDLWMSDAVRREINGEDPGDGPEHADEVNRLLGAGRYLIRRMAEELAPFDREIQRLMAQYDEIEARYRKAIEFIEWRAEQWHRQQYGLDPKRTSIKLPNGTLRSRKEQPAVIVSDETEADAWLGSYESGMRAAYSSEIGEIPPWVRVSVKASLALNEAKKAAADGRLVDDDTGEMLDWVTVTQPTDADRNYSVDWASSRRIKPDE